LKNSKVTFSIILCLIITFLVTSAAFSEAKVQQSARRAVVALQQAPLQTQVSQLEAPPQPQTPAQPEAPPQPQTPPQPQKSSPTVSFFFDDADIFEVAQTIFADILKVNYIIDPQVKGRVNFRTVTPIPKTEVLNVMEIIFRLNGIGFVEEGGLYRIIPLTEVSHELVYSQIGKSPDKVAIEMFTFKNLDIKESMPDIENALGLHLKGGTVRIMPIYRLNALIVIASSREQLEYIKTWVVTFDSMFAAARPKIFVYALQNSKAEHIASLMQSILSGGASTGAIAAPKPPSTPSPPKTPQSPQSQQTPPTTSAPRTGVVASVTGGGGFVSQDTKIFADEITNSLIILSTPTDYTFIAETIKRLDIMPRQVVIEGLVAQVELTDNLSLGFSWSLSTDLKISGLKPFNRDINLGGSAVNTPQGTDLKNTSGDGFTFVATDPKGIVRAKLTAALTTSKAKVLAAPHILVLDNREARIQVGSQVPLATSTTSYIPSTTTTAGETTLNPITSTIQYKDIGIILKVKPQINDSGLVSIELSQEVSSVGQPVTIAGQDFSSINKTETTTNLIAQDGETIIIGGLIREDTTKQKNGIPFLSSIPIIGNLFSFRKDTSNRTELIILLTPHVVKNHKEAGDVTADYVDRYKGATKDKDIDEFIKEKSQTKRDDKNNDKIGRAHV
jgi:type II secretion system protein D